MRSVLFTVCVVLLAALQVPVLLANEAKEIRAEAEQYDGELNFKKAYKLYYKLARSGDRYSQDRISHMYANGEGKSVNLTEVYAWAVVAAEGIEEKLARINEDLLDLTKDSAAAEKKAAKLVKKYGRQAQLERIARIQQRNSHRDTGSCTGSMLACPRN